jgi:(1->4)-alpha-D-glucan 1-alpha-D-glucosylmutase
MLEELRAGMSAEQMLARMDEGYPKLWVLSEALRVRAERAESLTPRARYEPLTIAHHPEERTLAFLRADDVLVVVRRFAGPHGDEASLTVPPGAWTQRFTGERIQGGVHSVRTLLSRFPVALFVRD